MADAADIQAMAERLTANFSAPETKWAGEAVKVLKDLPADALDGAATKLLTTRGYRSFPTFAEIREAALDWQAEQHRAKARKESPGPTEEQQREAKAWSVIRSELGVRAANERWAPGLFDFVATRGHAPDESEIKGIRGQQRNVDAQAQEARKLKAFGAPLYELRQSMHERYGAAALEWAEQQKAD